MKRIRFKGREYLFVGDSLEEGGAIATVRQYRNGLVSHAHLFQDGRILRFYKQIGTRADIKVLGPARNYRPTKAAMARARDFPFTMDPLMFLRP